MEVYAFVVDSFYTAARFTMRNKLAKSIPFFKLVKTRRG